MSQTDRAMTDRDAFLAAIIAAPDDDLPRLVYADYLDEQGEGERAELIRVQCELAGMIGDGSRCYACGWPIRDDATTCEPDSYSFRPTERSGEYAGWHRRQMQFHALRGRERELWAGECGAGLAAEVRAMPITLEPRLTPVEGYTPGPPQALFRRGFISGITCSWKDWLDNYQAILGSCPIANAQDGLARLTDRPRMAVLYSPDRLRLTGCRRWWKPVELLDILGGPFRDVTMHLLAAEFPGVRFELTGTISPPTRTRHSRVPARARCRWRVDA